MDNGGNNFVAHERPNKRYLGLDLGEKFIGVAINSDNLALPLTVLSTLENWLENLRNIFEQEQISDLVIGKPYASDGKTDSVSERWENNLNEISNLALSKGIMIHFIDERHTSSFVKKIISLDSEKPRGDISKPKTKAQDNSRIDSNAAAKLLQDFIDSQRMVYV